MKRPWMQIICLGSGVFFAGATAELWLDCHDLEQIVNLWMDERVEPDWTHLSVQLEQLAASTRVDEARDCFWQTLHGLEGGLPWAEDEERRGRFIVWWDEIRPLLEDDRMLAYSHYYRAMLAAHDPEREQDSDRRIRHLHAALVLDELDAEDRWNAGLEYATLLASAGMQQVDASGRIRFGPDYAAALDVINEMLESSDQRNHRQEDTLNALRHSILRPELHWQPRRSYFPDTEVEVTVHCRNLDTVELMFVSHPDDEVFAADDSGRETPESDVESVLLERMVFHPRAPHPHYPVERTWNLGVRDPGVYRLIARTNGHTVESQVLVTDVVLLAHIDDEEINFSMVDADRGEALFPLEWLAMTRDASGREVRQTGTADSAGPHHFAHRGAPGEPFKLTARVGDNRVAIMEGSVPHPSSALPEWMVDVSQPIFYNGQTAHWLLRPATMASASRLEALEPAELMAVWSDASGDERLREPVESVRGEVFAGELRIPLNWPEGVAYLRLDGEVGGEVVPLSRDLPVFRVLRAFSPDHGAIWLWPGNDRDRRLPIVVPGGEPLDIEVWLHGPDRSPLGNTPVEMRMYDSFSGDPHAVFDGLQTDEAGWLKYALQVPAGVSDDALLRLEIWMHSAGEDLPVTRHWLEGSPSIWRPRLRVDSAFHPPGSTVEAHLTIAGLQEADLSPPGVLIVHRDQWQISYVHRKRGTIITEDAWLQLPERSLLGTSQSDFRAGEAGLVTEEVFRMESTIQRGQAVFQIPAMQEGVYRVSWVGTDPGGQALQAETEFRVFRDGSLRGHRRPQSVELSFDHRETADDSLRAWLSVPTRDAHVLLVDGSAARQRFRWLEMGEGNRLLEWQAMDSREDVRWFEVNSFHQGTWTNHCGVFPVRERKAGVNVDLELPEGHLHPGSMMPVRVTVSDGGSGEPVPGVLSLRIRPVGWLDLEYPEQEGKNEHVRVPWRTKSSLENYPFHDPQEAVMEEQVAVDDGRRSRCAIRASWENLLEWSLPEARWRTVQLDPEQGGWSGEWLMPDLAGDWEFEVVFLDGEQRRARQSSVVSTDAAVLLEMSVPEILRAGDEALVTLRLSNRSRQPQSGTLKFQRHDSETVKSESLELESGYNHVLQHRYEAGQPGALEWRAYWESDVDFQEIRKATTVISHPRLRWHWRLKEEVRVGGRAEIETVEFSDAPSLLSFARKELLAGLPDTVEAHAARWFMGVHLDRIFMRDDVVVRDRWSPRIWRELQNEDGGVGFFRGAESDPWLTGWLLWSLAETAPEEGDGLTDWAQRAHEYLRRYLIPSRMESRLAAWILHANAHYHARWGTGRMDRLEARAYLQLLRELDADDPWIAALLYLVSVQQQFEDEAAMIALSVLSIGRPVDVASDFMDFPTSWEPILRLVQWRAWLWAFPESEEARDGIGEWLSATFNGGADYLESALAMQVFAEYLQLQSGFLAGADWPLSRTVVLQREAVSMEVRAGTRVPGSELQSIRRYLAPTLLRGWVRQEVRWTPEMALQVGDTLQLVHELSLPPGRTTPLRIQLLLPAGFQFVRSPELVGIQTAHHWRENTLLWEVQLDEEPQAEAPRIRLELKATHEGRFRLPALRLIEGRSLNPILLSESLEIDVVSPR